MNTIPASEMADLIRDVGFLGELTEPHQQVLRLRIIDIQMRLLAVAVVDVAVETREAA